MSDELPQTEPSSELMVARINVEELGSATKEKEISDALQVLKGVTVVTIAKGAVHVTYDPLETSEKHLEQAIRGAGGTVTAADTDRETPHPDGGLTRPEA
ncbi:MAG: hypothetical protein ABJB69_10005 [Spartobacteria bacterium]